MWSSQQYKQAGRQQGRDNALLDTAIEQTERLLFSGKDMPSILSLNHLATRSSIHYGLLRGFVSRTDIDSGNRSDIYQKFSIRKRSGGRRFIHVPMPALMKAQRWINQHILTKVQLHTASQAFAEGCSIKKCAVRHCGAAWLIKLDIADFFESISEIQVYRVFKELGYQPLVAFELARLCTVETASFSPRRRHAQWRVKKPNLTIPHYHKPLLGYLPQGAPTSPLLANIVMIDADTQLAELAAKFGLTYTRYSDDLSFSTKFIAFNRKKASELIFEAYKILSGVGLRPQYRKAKVIPPSAKKIILGLNVDGPMPRLQKQFKDRIRQHLYYLEKLGPIEHAYNRKFDSVWGLKCHLKGMIDFANMIEPEYAKGCLDAFNQIDWPV